MSSSAVDILQVCLFLDSTTRAQLDCLVAKVACQHIVRLCLLASMATHSPVKHISAPPIGNTIVESGIHKEI